MTTMWKDLTEEERHADMEALLEDAGSAVDNASNFVVECLQKSAAGEVYDPDKMEYCLDFMMMAAWQSRGLPVDTLVERLDEGTHEYHVSLDADGLLDISCEWDKEFDAGTLV